MRRSLVLIALLLTPVPALSQSGPPPGGGPGGPGEPGEPGRPMRPPKPPEPLKRSTFDRAVIALFSKGDTNRDGIVTLAELRAEIDARRDELIEARFRRLDTDRNGSLGRAEFVAWQRQMGTVALSEDQALPRDAEMVPAFIEPDVDDDDVALRRLIEPLSATMLVKANTNYDSGTTLAELAAYEGARFEAADTDGDGTISMEEVRLPGPGRAPRPAGLPGDGPPGGRN